MQCYVGTSGYSYKEWLGRFYPPKHPANAMLRYYAQHFNTVEINNTFYRMPGEGMLARWREEVPVAFSFTLKAPRRITHDKRLRDAGVEVAEFLRRASALGDKFGAAFFQLPPSMRKDVALLADFLGILPSDTRAAFEFRHRSWHDDDVYETLRARGAALCISDTDEGETPFAVTSPFGYFRLRRTEYEDSALESWITRIAKAGYHTAYVYFKHEDEARGPDFARRFLALSRTADGTT